MAHRKSKSGMWGRKALIALALVLSAELVSGVQGHHKLSSDLETVNSSDSVDVIVQFKQQPTAYHHQKVFNRGGSLHRELGLIRGGAYHVPARVLRDLADDDDVAYISPDRPVTGAASVINDYHTGSINTSAAWSAGLTGSGIGVAVIDSGIVSSSPDLTYSRTHLINALAA
jgi:serine protease AprX